MTTELEMLRTAARTLRWDATKARDQTGMQALADDYRAKGERPAADFVEEHIRSDLAFADACDAGAARLEAIPGVKSE